LKVPEHLPLHPDRVATTTATNRLVTLKVSSDRLLRLGVSNIRRLPSSRTVQATRRPSGAIPPRSTARMVSSGCWGLTGMSDRLREAERVSGALSVEHGPDADSGDRDNPTGTWVSDGGIPGLETFYIASRTV
jgi:hypothetical protein